jgi:hypothetical protein
MIYGLYAFYDTIAEEYSAPFMQKNRNLAKRIHENHIKSGANPAELMLYHIGDYDNEHGTLILTEKKEV